MTSLTLKTIDFAKETISSKNVDVSSDLAIESAKSVAYVVRWQLARRRAGSAHTKVMSEISGTTAKPYKQKGTGNARQGSKRSVQFVGGRTCHGPRSRSFDFTMPGKIIKKALSDVLRFKLQENKISLFSGFGSEIKTAKLNSVLNKAEFSSTLIIHTGSEACQALVKSAKNIKNVKTLDVKGLNVYDILNFDHIIVDDAVFKNNILGAIA